MENENDGWAAVATLLLTATRARVATNTRAVFLMRASVMAKLLGLGGKLVWPLEDRCLLRLVSNAACVPNTARCLISKHRNVLNKRTEKDLAIAASSASR